MSRGRDIGALRRAINDLMGGYYAAGLNFFGGDKLEVLVFVEDVDRTVESLENTCGFRHLANFKPDEGKSNRNACLERWRRETTRDRVPPAVRAFFVQKVIELERAMETADVEEKHLLRDKQWDSDDNTVDGSHQNSVVAPKAKVNHVTFSDSSKSSGTPKGDKSTDTTSSNIGVTPGEENATNTQLPAGGRAPSQPESSQ